MAVEFGRGEAPSLYPNMPDKAMSRLNRSDVERFSRYSIYWKFYTGKHWEHQRRDGDELVTINLPRLFVNKGASFLMRKGWTIKDTEEEPYSEEKIKFLNRFWKLNNKKLVSMEMAQMGGMMGDVFAVVLPDNNDFLTLNIIAPMYVHPTFHPANRNLIMDAVIEQPIGDPLDNVVMRTYLDSIWIRQYIGEEKIYERQHGLGEPPIVFIKNRVESGTAFGVSDLAPIIPLNKILNKKETEISDIVNYHSAPVTLAYGVRLKQMQKGARKMWAGLPSPKDAKIENLELKSDLEAAIRNSEKILDYIFMVGEMPEIAFGRNLAISNTSGTAIQMMYQPLIEASSSKQITYGSGIQSINRIVTKYGNMFGYIKAPKLKTIFDKHDYLHTDIEFQNPLPMDELLNLNMLINRLNSGTITMANFLSEVGVENVKKYIKELKDDAENGVNLFSAERLNNFKMQNIGGINRQPSTIDDDSDIIKNDKNPKPDIEQRADAAKRIQDRDKTVRSKMV